MGKDRRRGPAWGKLAIFGAITLGLAAAWRFTPLSELLTLERVTAWSGAIRETRWAPVALVLAYTPAALTMFPRQVLTLLAVIVFGPWLGVSYAVAGVLLAALSTYVAGRWIPYESVRRLCGERIDAVKEVARNHGVATFFASNMSPVPPFAIQGIMAGAMRVNVWHYSAGTLLSMIPGVAAFTVFGNEIASALKDPSRVSYGAVAAAAVALGLFIYFTRRWIARRGEGG